MEYNQKVKDRNPLGLNILKLRRAKGLKQYELAENLGLDKDSISNYERGLVKRPPIETISKMAKFFGVTMDFLFAEHGEEWDGMPPKEDEKNKSKLTLSDLGEILIKHGRLLESILEADEETRNKVQRLLAYSRNQDQSDN